MHVKSKLSLLLLALAVGCSLSWTVHASSGDPPEDIQEETADDTGDFDDGEVLSASDIPENVPEDTVDDTGDFDGDEVLSASDIPEDNPDTPESDMTEPEQEGEKEDETLSEEDVGELLSASDIPENVPEDTVDDTGDFDGDEVLSASDIPEDNPDTPESDMTELEQEGEKEDETLSEEDIGGLSAGEEEEEANDYFFEKEFTEYTVTEGLLLLIFCTLFCRLCIDLTTKMNHWRMY